MKKGIAFPTCLSVNNCICHFSPSKNDPDYTLKAGDVVKIDLGAHIDGFIAVAAHTIVVGATGEAKATGRAADVVLAAYHASQAALRQLKDGTSNYAVTEAVQKIAAEYKCKPIEGMLSHQLKQFKIDGEKTIIQNPTIAQKKEHEKCTFEKYEVYAMDVLVSTGEGLGKELDTKVSIYKKTEENYLLKLKASRAFYAEVSGSDEAARSSSNGATFWVRIPLPVVVCPMITNKRSRSRGRDEVRKGVSRGSLIGCLPVSGHSCRVGIPRRSES